MCVAVIDGEYYKWHFHPDSDEIFVVLKERLVIEFRRAKVVLALGEMFTIKVNVKHKTSSTS